MPTFYKTRQAGVDVDFEDIYIRKDYFSQSSLWNWGSGSALDAASGRLGNNAADRRSSPVQVNQGGSNWISADAFYHVIAISTAGLYGWGNGEDGAIGVNNTTNYSLPVFITSDIFLKVSCGSTCTAAIRNDGKLFLWGSGSLGKMGDNTVNNRSSPVQLGTFSWKDVAVFNNVLAVRDDNTLWAWGNNQYGKLGVGDEVNRSSPVQVGSGTDWKQVSTNQSFSAAIKTDGTLWCVGGNFQGQMGDNSTIFRSSPVQVAGGGTNWKVVSSGNQSQTALKYDGSLWVWGRNNIGQLGLNNLIDKSSPTQVGGSLNWKYIACEQGVVATKADGTLWAWGQNNRGQLGLNDLIDRSSPTQIGNLTNWSKVISAEYYGGALRG